MGAHTTIQVMIWENRGDRPFLGRLLRYAKCQIGQQKHRLGRDSNSFLQLLDNLNDNNVNPPASSSSGRSDDHEKRAHLLDLEALLGKMEKRCPACYSMCRRKFR